MCMFCISAEVTLCGWLGYKPSINKQTNKQCLKKQRKKETMINVPLCHPYQCYPQNPFPPSILPIAKTLFVLLDKQKTTVYVHWEKQNRKQRWLPAFKLQIRSSRRRKLPSSIHWQWHSATDSDIELSVSALSCSIWIYVCPPVALLKATNNAVHLRIVLSCPYLNKAFSFNLLCVFYLHWAYLFVRSYVAVSEAKFAENVHIVLSSPY